jgi:GDP-4-dehydro-6-deoxy-D-mannose reductase
MRVLVLGGGGFVGRQLVRRLRSERAAMVWTGGRAAAMPGDDRHLVCDVTRYEQVAAAVRAAAPQFVVNLAGAVRGSAPSLHAVNAAGAVNVLCALRDHAPAAGLIQFGSAAEYGRAGGAAPIDEELSGEPAGAYGHSKLAATTILRSLAPTWGVRSVVVRPFNIVGAGCPSELVVGALVERIHRAVRTGQSEIVVGRTDTRRDFVAVEDVVSAVLGIIEARQWPSIVNVCSGVATEIAAVVARLIALSGAKLNVTVDPALVRSDDSLVSYGSYELLHSMTGFVPKVPLEESLRRAWEQRAVRAG